MFYTYGLSHKEQIHSFHWNQCNVPVIAEVRLVKHDMPVGTQIVTIPEFTKDRSSWRRAFGGACQ